MILQSAPEAAIENVITAINRLPNAFPNNYRARTKICSQDADTADLGIGCDATDNSSDGCAMTVDIGPIARLHLDLNARVHHMQIVEQSKSRQIGMIYFD